MRALLPAPLESFRNHDAMIQRVARHFGGGVHPELQHNTALMKFDGSYRDIQNGTDLFQTLAVGNELQHFALARSQPASEQTGRLFARLERRHPWLEGNARTDIIPVAQYITDRFLKLGGGGL